jgi:guanine deaminase
MPQAYRSRILHFVDEPALTGESAWQYLEDGLLLVEQGRVVAVGPAQTQLQGLTVPVEHFPNHLILPGFVDTHIHYPQTEMIAAYGEQLLSWLNHYTFPAETKFSDPHHAATVARFFFDELLRNGTTTALVFGTVHPASVEAFFREAQQRNLRMIAGKVLMDRNAPPQLCDSPEQGYRESRQLIERWHGVDRLQYAVTPRFAPTSSDAQLKRAGELLREFPDVYMHTHLAENTDEVAWIKTLFPSARHYLDVYDREGLLGRRSVFAHGVHLCDEECKRLAEAKSAIAHCPTSNLFLGSGLFDMARMQSFGVRIGLGTDVGGGTSFSLFRTLDEAYKIQQLRGNCLDPFQALYLATLGGARTLDLEGRIGNFLPGSEADFMVLDLQATPLLRFRLPHCNSLGELLFVLNTLGDDRLVERTYALGNCVHRR